MKTLIITAFTIAFAAILALTSCSKKGDTKPTTTIKQGMGFTFNGSTTTFNSCGWAANVLSGYTLTQVVGLDEDASGNETGNSDIVIAIASETALQSGQIFTGAQLTQSGGKDGVSALYFIGSTNYLTPGTGADFTITLSSVSSQYIKGTFSGTVYNGSTAYTIANGTFTAFPGAKLSD